MLLLVSRDLDTVVEYSYHCVVSYLAALRKPLPTHRTGKPEPINDKELSGEYPLSLPALAGVSGLVDLQLAGCLEPLVAVGAGVGPRGGVARQVGGQVGPAGDHQ